MKIRLANRATEMLHGKERTLVAEKTASDIFRNEGSSENLPHLAIDLVKNSKVFLNDLIVEIGFATSKSEARKLIKNSGVKINRIVVSEELRLLTKDDFNAKACPSTLYFKHFLIKLIN